MSVLGPLLSLPAVLGLVIAIKEAAGWAESPTAPVDPVLPKIGVCVCVRYLSGQKMTGNTATSHGVELLD